MTPTHSDDEMYTVQSSDVAFYISTTMAINSLNGGHTLQNLSLDGPAIFMCENGHDHQTSGSHHNNDDHQHEGSKNMAIQRLRESFRDSVLDLYAAIKIFAIHLVTFESLFVMVSSIVATTGYYVFGESSSGANFGANISWTMVTFAVVAPMIMQIKQAFTRRELALEMLAESKALFCNILLANALWNWGDNGRQKLPTDHAQVTKTLLKTLLRDSVTLLRFPTLTRGRHRLTDRGRKIASRYMHSVDQLQLQIIQTIHKLHEQVEVMKRAGLPANEASRINQYHWLLQARLEKLQNIKFYRTPQATRSFTRLFILLLPIFYGPYYVYIARGDEYNATNFAFCLFLSVATSLTMIGVFNIEKAMEDPFAGGGLDAIRLQETRQLILAMLDTCYQPKTMSASSLSDSAAGASQPAWSSNSKAENAVASQMDQIFTPPVV